jgi:hypothetical protein
LQTETEAEFAEVSIKTTKKNKNQSKQQRKIRMGGRDEAKAGSRIRTSDLDKKDKTLVHLVNSFCKS